MLRTYAERAIRGVPGGTAVMNGREPTVSGTDRKVWVTAGQVQINGTAVTVLGGTGNRSHRRSRGPFDRYGSGYPSPQAAR